jgi:hypothetical protein
MAFDMRRAAGEKGADFGRQRRIGHPPNWPTPAHWRIGASGGGTGGHARPPTMAITGMSSWFSDTPPFCTRVHHGSSTSGSAHWI